MWIPKERLALLGNEGLKESLWLRTRTRWRLPRRCGVTPERELCVSISSAMPAYFLEVDKQMKVEI